MSTNEAAERLRRLLESHDGIGVSFLDAALAHEGEVLRIHEPEPSTFTDRWDCSCGWHQEPATAQIWWDHVFARLAEGTDR